MSSHMSNINTVMIILPLKIIQNCYIILKRISKPQWSFIPKIFYDCPVKYLGNMSFETAILPNFLIRNLLENTLSISVSITNIVVLCNKLFIIRCQRNWLKNYFVVGPQPINFNSSAILSDVFKSYYFRKLWDLLKISSILEVCV